MSREKKTAAGAATNVKGTGKRCAPEYRREALRQLDSGRSQGEVAEEFGVTARTLGRRRLLAASVVTRRRRTIA